MTEYFKGNEKSNTYFAILPIEGNTKVGSQLVILTTRLPNSTFADSGERD